jgi:[protein-PII] uridylyltransferase
MEGIVPISEHRARIQQEVAKRLAADLSAQEVLPIKKLQILLKKEEHRLKLWHRAGGGGKEIAGRRAELVDIIFREIFRHTVFTVTGEKEIQGLSVSAFGGYGRRELNPFSDVDINFIHAGKKPTPAMEKIISVTLLTLWDLGFKVGHATRSVQGSIDQANKDMTSKTAMLESRWLVGDKKLFEQFKTEFDASCIKGYEKDYIAWRMQNLQELRGKFGASVFMQEPNIKSGSGGLRFYQNLLWTGMFHSGASSMTRLVEEKVLRDRERRALEEAHDFLLRVRTEMHYQTGRAAEQLTLQLQGKVATALGYPQKNILRRCEAFMREYYQQTRQIYLITTLALGRLKEQQEERQEKKHLFTKLMGRTGGESVGEFLIRHGELFPKSREIFNSDPSRMMRSFQLAQRRGLNFSAELEDLVKRRLRLVDRTFQYNKENRTIFLSILSRKGEVSRILRLMHDLGFLGKYLPEFEPLTCLVQHEFFHRYTADEHTLLCTEKIDELLFSTEPKFQRYASLFRHLEDPAMLYLAMLLHDTGKAANTLHHEDASAIAAQKVAKRLQLAPQRRKMLITLVDAHGELAGFARARNLEDPATVEEFAEIIRDPVILDALMVLTLADGMGTSDDGWSDWKELLVWQLYHQAKSFLADGEGFREERRKRRDDLRKQVAEKLPADFAEEIEAHFAGMPERYLAFKDRDEISAHLLLFRKFFEEGLLAAGPHLDPVIEWIDHPEAGYAEVILCGWDRDRLLERISAAFLEAGINVLGADIYTRADYLALDIFRVANNRNEPLPREKARRVFEERLCTLLQVSGSRIVPEPATKPSPASESQDEELPVHIIVNNQAHPTCTILEVQAPDRIGLLYHLLRAISHGGIKIEAARIATEQKAALDVFYLRSKEGGKIHAIKDLARLERRIRAATLLAGKAR